MADITKLTRLFIGQAEKRNSSDSTKADIPRLAASVDVSATTFVFTKAIGLDEDGTRTTLPAILSITNEAGYTEHIYVAAGEFATDGLSCTIASVNQRGLQLSSQNGIDLTTGVSANRAKHESGSAVRFGVYPGYWDAMVQVMQGYLASGGASWKIGRGTDEDVIVYIANGDANEPFWGYDASENKLIFSNDGVSSTPFGTGAGVTGGDGITVTAGDIDIDTTDTTVFVETTAGAADEGKVAKLDAAGLIKAANVETLKDVTATSTEINQALDGISANVTDTNLNTLTAGTSSDASALHTHSMSKILDTSTTTVNYYDVNDGTSEKTIYSYAVPANTLASDRIIRLKAHWYLKGSNSNTDLDVFVKYDGQNVAHLEIESSSSNSRGYIEADIIYSGASTQRTNWKALFFGSQLRIDTTVAGGYGFSAGNIEDTTVNTSLNKNLTITAVNSSGIYQGYNIDFETVSVELIQ